MGLIIVITFRISNEIPKREKHGKLITKKNTYTIIEFSSRNLSIDLY